MSTPASPFKTVAEVAEYLCLSCRLIAYGELKPTCFGGALRIHENDLWAFIGRFRKPV